MRNLTNEKVQKFIESHIFDGDELQKEMEIFAEKNGVPIVTKDTLALLKSLIKIKKPQEILEFGTAIGYSSIEMVKASNDLVIVTTVERNEKRFIKAKEYIEKANYEKNIRLFLGDAIELDLFLDRNYDMVFIDAAKGQYQKFFDKIINNVSKGGLIISDNIFHNALVCEENIENVERRQRTIYRRMNDYLNYLTNTDGLSTSLVPIGDGLAITIVNGE